MTHTHILWVQQAIRSKRLELKIVLGEETPADLFTKHNISKWRLENLSALFDCHFGDGLAQLAPAMRTRQGEKVTIAGASRTSHATDGSLNGAYDQKMRTTA